MVDLNSQKPGYETRDVSVPVVAWFAVGLVLAALVVLILIAGLYKSFGRHDPSLEPAARIAQKPPMLAPPPQLQINPVADLQRFKADEEVRLNRYGWVDKPTGIIRIPIQRAMELIAQRGLPTRVPGSQNASAKTPIDMQKEKAAATKP